jgi:hypothetical protein
VSRGVRGNALVKASERHSNGRLALFIVNELIRLRRAAVDKQTGQTVAVDMSAPGVLADACEMTGLPKDCFELRRISREEWERLGLAGLSFLGGLIESSRCLLELLSEPPPSPKRGAFASSA